MLRDAFVPALSRWLDGDFWNKGGIFCVSPRITAAFSRLPRHVAAKGGAWQAPRVDEIARIVVCPEALVGNGQGLSRPSPAASRTVG